jgi:DNA-binding LacI/PurR family transcriptional regulator
VQSRLVAHHYTNCAVVSEPSNLAWFGGVDIDNRYGGHIATDHLLAGGFQHIGLIAGPTAWYAAEMRKQGWETALQKAGKQPEPRQIAIGDWTPQSGERALYALKSSFPEMDAVFVANDQMAFGALRAASDLNLRVPDDLAVVGYDDIPEAAFTQPRLTTIHQQVIELGRLSVEKLIALIAPVTDAPASEQADSGLLQPTLVVRESSRGKQ